MIHARVASSLCLLALLLCTAGPVSADDAPAKRPNFVVILVDDVGYGDIGPFGARDIATPHLDRMAQQGMRLTDFYVHPVCGVTRAAFMTGSYAMRCAEVGNAKDGHPILHPDEVTVAETLKSAGYATALIGKWHLAGPGRGGYDPALLPNAQGFDYWFGTPTHNGHTRTIAGGKFRAQLMRNGELIDDAVDQAEMDGLTKRYTDEAVAWLRERKGEPFFLCLAHNMAHVVLGATDEFRGSGPRGLYGDVIRELDASVGRVLDTLRELGVADETLVIFTSDNGPWVEKHLAGETPEDDHYGRAGPLRGFKMTTWEGGVRVPTLAWWPGCVPAGATCVEPATIMDLMPTFAALAGTEPPTNRVIDGRDIRPLLYGDANAKSPHDAIFHYSYTQLQAVRSGRWKLVLPRPAKPAWLGWSARMTDAVPEPMLIDLATDLGETRNVASEHPQVVAELMAHVERARADIGDYDRIGENARFFDDGPRRRESQRWIKQRPIAASERPNFIVVFADDLGYGDLGCFGSTQIRTPRIDQLAAEGMRLTRFYAQPVCGPSRAALMTGCYPLRVAEVGNEKRIHPALHPQEITIAEVLRERGYATGCFGKWDLAEHSQRDFKPALMPTRQGFDYFFGTPTSNDKLVDLYRNGERIEADADMATLTQRYTDEAIAFMERHRDRPFFVYVPHTMPHTRLAASEAFRGKSPRGLYGDVVEEIDHHVGRLVDAVERMGLSERTYVIVTSDNGPWLIKNKGRADGTLPGDHGGSAGPLRSGKVSTWEGGQRVPAVVWAPGRVPAGADCNALTSTLDVLPTLAALAGAQTPTDRIIDGQNIAPLLHGETDRAPDDKAFYYYAGTHLQAVRQGPWKLHLPRPAKQPWSKWSPNRHIASTDDIAIERPMLVNLQRDIGETTDVAPEHPGVVRRLLALAEQARADIGDYDRIGAGARFFDDGPRRPESERWIRQPVLAAAPAAAPNADAPAAEEPGVGFDFETGDTQGWEVVDGAFAALINNRPNFHHTNNAGPYNKQGTWFLTTLESGRNGRPDDTQTGVIESPVFKMTGPGVSFLQGGGGHAETYIALVDAETGRELKQSRGRNGEMMQRVEWSDRRWVGRHVFLRVVDDHRGGWGHVTLDDVHVAAVLTPDVKRPRGAAAHTPPTEPSAKPKLLETDITHSFLACGQQTYIVDEAGKIVWRYPHSTRDGYVLPSGNVVLAVSKGRAYPGGAVVEVTRDGAETVIWKGTQSEVNSVQPVSVSGGAADELRFVITEAGPNPRLIEVDRAGQIHAELTLDCQRGNHHMQTRMARKLLDGTYLAPHLLDFAVKRYAADGRVLQTIDTTQPGDPDRKIHSWPFTAIRLLDGSTHVNLTHANRSARYDAAGELTWLLTNDDLPGPWLADPCGAQVLPSGNVVITSYGQRDAKLPKLIEVNADKQVVWTYTPPGPMPGIHHFQILTTNGKPIDGPPMK